MISTQKGKRKSIPVLKTSCPSGCKRCLLMDRSDLHSEGQMQIPAGVEDVVPQRLQAVFADGGISTQKGRRRSLQVLKM